jgi:protein-S-isoprenylcysteine O-methyltransferase Ste14
MEQDEPKPETKPAGVRLPPRPPLPPAVGLAPSGDGGGNWRPKKETVRINLPPRPIAVRRTIVIHGARATSDVPRFSFVLLLRNVMFTILLPGTVTVVVPCFMVAGKAGGEADSWRCLGLLPVMLGVGILFRCIWDFAIQGRGTLAPVDPPKFLVIRGLYRYVRNPMYLGVLLILTESHCYFGQAGCWFMRFAFCWSRMSLWHFMRSQC